MEKINRILLVDDEQDQLELTRLMIQREYPGTAVVTAATVEEACATIGREEAFDILVADMKMSRERDDEGVQVVSDARAKSPLTYIIVLTAYGSLRNVYEVLGIKIDQYISRNMSEAEQMLKAEIGKALK